MNHTDAPDYSPLAFGTGLALGLMLLLALPRATNERPSAPLVDARGTVGRRLLRGDAGAQLVELHAAHRALARTDQAPR